ncbi:flagellar hook-length control protein FliK [Biostraticola tofi]|uniref:Flagellar hook-length control protein FliK n=1 Tax=Biostraticola tofi TaxID=466109 RepID=A0A4R3YRQ7_9GAMM|nr:flagellar hook-length control protein FliK [Biostraticola tofi]TCV95557.1 flagellar hook-length control protein FliK [Biostraticola tofi]
MILNTSNTIAPSANGTRIAANNDTDNNDFKQILQQQSAGVADRFTPPEPSASADENRPEQAIDALKDAVAAKDRAKLKEAIAALLQNGTQDDGTPLAADQIAYLEQLLAQLVSMPADDSQAQLQPTVDRQLAPSPSDPAGRSADALFTAFDTALLRSREVGENGGLPAMPLSGVGNSSPADKDGTTSRQAKRVNGSANTKAPREYPLKPLMTAKGARQTPPAEQITPAPSASGQPVAQSAPAVMASPAPASVSTAAPAAAANPHAPLLQQPLGTPAWQQALSQQLSLFLSKGTYHAELKLNPRDLGALQISMKLNNDQLQLHVMSENQQVRAAVEASMPYLRTSLAESGMTLSQSSVGPETTSQQRQADSENAGRHSRQQQPENTDNALAIDEPSARALDQMIARDGRVDIYA